MNKILLSLIVSTIFIFSGMQAKAAVITFEDYFSDTGRPELNYDIVVSPYKNMDWDHLRTGILNTDAYGLGYAASSGKYVAQIETTASLKFMDDSLFTFNGANFSAWFLSPNMTLRIEGFRDNNPVASYNTQFALPYGSYTHAEFNWENINKITFSSTTGGYFLVDDINITSSPAPEPSSLILGLIGLGSSFGLRKKRAGRHLLN